MTKFSESRFSVGVGSKAYRDNWDAVFGPKKDEIAPDVLKSLSQEEYARLEAPSEEALQAALDEGHPNAK